MKGCDINRRRVSEQGKMDGNDGEDGDVPGWLMGQNVGEERVREGEVIS